MEALLAPEKGETYASRMPLHFALGKAYLDLGDFAGGVPSFERRQPDEARDRALQRRRDGEVLR